jgi:FAD/FMN-containing dehydrogenase
VGALRGLLADLGAYSETAALVLGAGDANEGVASSCEGAAQVGAAQWRLTAATAALDPKGLMNPGKVLP